MGGVSWLLKCIKEWAHIPEGSAPVTLLNQASIALRATPLHVPVAQYLVGEDPEECEEVVVAHWQFDGELAFVLGVRAVDQILRKTLAVDMVDILALVEEVHEVGLDVAGRAHRHLPVVEVVPHREHSAVRERYTEDGQAYRLRGVFGDHLHSGPNLLVLLVGLR